MPPNPANTSTFSPEEFCLALKAARERKGITLAEIAAVTKISAYLMEGLERNDLRRWPTGLFRRSFFRDYVRMIGLPVAELCDEFVRLFPDEAAHDPGKIAQQPESAKPPRHSVLSALNAALKRAASAIMHLAKPSKTPPANEPERRAWSSDARRVGPAPSPRVRVRLKVPK